MSSMFPKLISRHSVFMAILCLTYSPAHAQVPETDTTINTQNLAADDLVLASRVQFNTLFLEKPTQDYTYFSQGEIKPFPVGIDLLSPKTDYAGQGPIWVFSGTPNIEQSLAEQAVATIPVTPGYSQTTFICAPSGSLLSCVPVNVDVTSFPKGSFMFINATADQVIGLLGKEKVAIQPGQFHLVRDDNFEARRIPIQLAHFKESQDWNIFYSTKWTVLGEGRSFIVIYKDASTERMLVRGINFRE